MAGFHRGRMAGGTNTRAVALLVAALAVVPAGVGLGAGGLEASPVVLVASYLGGGMRDEANALAFDADGDIYVAGSAHCGFPVQDASQAVCGGSWDGFVTKLTDNGERIVWSTYLGGSQQEYLKGIAVDRNGRVAVTGWTASPDFPTRDALQDTFGGVFDAFVTVFRPDGTVLWSTFFGGTQREIPYTLAMDPSGNVYIAGMTDSDDLPLEKPLVGTRCGGLDGFVTSVSADGQAVRYSTFLCGNTDYDGRPGSYDEAFAIAVDAQGQATVGGRTGNRDFPVRDPIQPNIGRWEDAFVVRLTPDGSDVVWGTFLGGREASPEEVRSIALGPDGATYVAGVTTSVDFPVAHAFQRQNGGVVGSKDAFAAKIAPDGRSLAYSTYLGGSGDDEARGIAVDAWGRAVVTGRTFSRDFPLFRSWSGEAPDTTLGDGFVTVLGPTGESLAFGSYLGGADAEEMYAAATREGLAVVAGTSNSQGLARGNAPQPAMAGGFDAFYAVFCDLPVARLRFGDLEALEGWASSSRVEVTSPCPIDTAYLAIDGGPFEARLEGDLGAEGLHEVQAYSTLQDAVGPTVTRTVRVDTTPPEVALVEPAAGALHVLGSRLLTEPPLPLTAIVGPVLVRVDASDALSGVYRVDLLLDGSRVDSDHEAPFEFAWNAGDAAAGGHVLAARAVDRAGNVAEAPLRIVTVPGSVDGVASTLQRVGELLGVGPLALRA